ncbi:hypothetical protein V474_22785 [Novosphingobium barchaimii LL02]|uniref:DUF1376 domain-containing protein n=1 Tax=Novosphingobium barchaimii LL02 TaxID=1114963 RepID=A0A0J7XPR2_9SPHN|nr:DUF1376 domain-containing protein [Novosphingobium barchaimii]KMS53609.1 hypothetical protein V474_22785 [Novosphingobium barchaimii LL02]
MNDDLPEPLTPPDCDLRKFRDMPLDVGRLRDSDLLTEEEPEAIVAALLLWGAAWHQVPAASVPDNDRWLAKAAGYGRAIEAWIRIRAGALRGFLLCSDGRLYHKTVAEKANAAWDSRLKYEWTKAADRHRKSQKDLPEKDRSKFPDFEGWKLVRQSSVDIPAEIHGRSDGMEHAKTETGKTLGATQPVREGQNARKTEKQACSNGNGAHFQRKDPEIPLENALKGNDRNRNESIDKSPTDSFVGNAKDGNRSVEGDQPADPDKVFWDEAKKYLSPKRSAQIGKWVKDHGREAVADAIKLSKAENAIDPPAYISACLRNAKQRADATKDAKTVEDEAFNRRFPERILPEDEARVLMSDAEFDRWKSRQAAERRPPNETGAEQEHSE